MLELLLSPQVAVAQTVYVQRLASLCQDLLLLLSFSLLLASLLVSLQDSSQETDNRINLLFFSL